MLDNFTCPEWYSWKCSRDHICLDDFKICDGNKDCADGSDEMLCEEKLCPSHYEKCADQKTCIFVGINSAISFSQSVSV